LGRVALGAPWPAIDSRALLLKRSGHEDTNAALDDWYCIYDLETREASFDLRQLNAGAVHFKR
jgi:hypothetical protein